MLVALDAHPIREDEALYAAWALGLARHDFWLVGVPVDKPPLFLWLLAAWQQTVGSSVAAMRLLNVALSLLSATLLYALARRLTDRPSAWLTLAVYAASPFAILFAPTLYTDPLLTTTLLAACLAAVQRRWGWLGFCLGLALATKQQALLLLPLLVCLMPRPLARPPWAAWRGLLGLILALGPALVWDAHRLALTPPGGPPTVWVQSAVSYGGLSLAPLSAWLPRLVAWLTPAQVLAPGWASAGLLLLGVALALRQGWQRRSSPSSRPWRSPAGPPWELPLLGFVLIYLALQVVVSFQVWDRYLLPLAPLLALYSALALRWLWRRGGPIILLIGLLLLSVPAWRAAHGGYPVGSDHGAYDGIEEAALVVRQYLPDNPFGVLYHHWLGWHWQYYLDGAQFQRIYYPTPDYLAADAAGPPQYTRLVVIPAWRQDDALAAALAAQGLRLHWLHSTYRPDGSPSFLIYRIEPISDL
ncbi:glycosyltransferase family 39 protein [Candidatus Amarolinea dominans]|uniref:ArnT family glycosyltransferase n=1 Tax=Candidatus Amarolinea dominans TaxID=3140696 RepID=UPI0031CCBEFE